jgi:hypothetical protein
VGSAARRRRSFRLRAFQRAKDFAKHVSSREIFQQKHGLFSAKWNYLPGLAGQNFPLSRQNLPLTSADRQTQPSAFFLASAKSMFKRF